MFGFAPGSPQFAAALGDGGPPVLFRYGAGSLVSGLGGTFTNASSNGVPSYVNSAGVVSFVNTNVIRDQFYLGGVGPYALLEGARTNNALWNRDFTNVAWVKVNATVALDQTGADGTANSASSILATAGNATVLQTLVLASATRFTSAYVKRLTGTGTINMTTDAGATWTAVTLTAGWTRVTIPAQAFLNPVFGFQIVTNGDKIAVDFFQNEAGAFQSSVIPTTTVAVTRSADGLSFPFLAVPQATTVYWKGVNLGTIAVGGYLWAIGSAAVAAPTVYAEGNSSNPRIRHNNSSATVTSTPANSPVYGDTFEFLGTLDGTGAVNGISTVNGGAQVAGGASATNALQAAWSGTVLTVNGTGGSGSIGFCALQRLVIAAGVLTLNQMRAIG